MTETNNIMITCGMSFAGYEIREYLGFVSGDVLVRNAFPCVIDTEFPDEAPVFGTPHVEKGDQIAIQRMKEMAEKLAGVNAVCNVAVSYTVLSPVTGTVLITASGTAVRAEAATKKEAVKEEEPFPEAGEPDDEMTICPEWPEPDDDDENKTVAVGNPFLPYLQGAEKAVNDFAAPADVKKAEEAQPAFSARPRWCPKCHAGVEPDMLFCYICGTKLL